jgi:Family of unknown function (DUF6328)
LCRRAALGGTLRRPQSRPYLIRYGRSLRPCIALAQPTPATKAHHERSSKIARVAEKSPEDLDRELIELLNELRVTLPGVQVLFAFLLIAPFSQGFDRVNDLQKFAYLAALTFTALGSAFLIAPTPYHRIRFRDRDKEAMLRYGNRLALTGTVCLATAISCALFFVTDFLFRSPVPALVTALVVLVIVTFWYALPLARELRE